MAKRTRNFSVFCFIIMSLAFMSDVRGDVFDMPAGYTSLETVSVGNPGNASGNDGLGGVAYEFRISKYEITAAQYTEFLNAVAAIDTYGLYNTDMTAANGCQIQRIGSSGNYTYSISVDAANRPVNKISWADAARFVNWLHNGQPTGSQDLATTEDGAYYLNGATTLTELNTVIRENDWLFALTSETEWFKAAYHKNDGATDNYWLYPTATDDDPNAQIGTPDPGNCANFDKLLGAAPWRTVVGEFENSASPYGTFDQGGNVLEMTEDLWAGNMIARGGSYWTNDVLMRKTNASGRDIANTRLSEENNLGFRIVAYPPTDVFNMGADLTSLEFVPVGNAGNSSGSDGFGGVAYDYCIGMYEITAAQYTVFLNAVAADDTYHLYDTAMTLGTHACQIKRWGNPGSYVYTVVEGYGNLPVNKVTWGDAARFVNWLHNGQPTGSQSLTTTEDGAYYLNGAMTEAELNAVAREVDWQYAITSESEWFKAAYHKNDGVTDNYWLYPTATDDDPTAAIVDPDPGNNANFSQLLGDAPWRTVVGEFENSDSPYGTFDQGGNVMEMTESLEATAMASRGGAYWYNDAMMRKTNAQGRYLGFSRASVESILGFRVVMAPPPPPTDVFDMGPDLTSVEFVPVRNAGNSSGTDGFGGVAYDYSIGKYEITAAQYTVFLNAVAATDTYGLYNHEMTAANGCQIQRFGEPGNFTYTVSMNHGDRPVNKISWADAARFVNWLHNDQPSGLQDLTSTEDGAYYLNGAVNQAEINAVVRQGDAVYAIANEDEWFKAAYHKNNGVTDNYWLYPTATDADPNNTVVEPDPGNNANFGQMLGAAPWRTEVGEFENSTSAYGTFDQGGNVLEMTEGLSDSSLVARGGSYWTNDAAMRKTNATGRNLSNTRLSEENGLGFRIVLCPEPVCGDWGYYSTDFDHDCYVGLSDVALMSNEWLECTDPIGNDCQPNVIAGEPSFKIHPGTATLDGDLSEWADVEWIDADVVYYGNPSDMSNAKWAALWDDTANLLYIAAQVTDTDQTLEPNYVNWNMHDHLEIYVDAANSDASSIHLNEYVDAQHYLLGIKPAGGAWCLLGSSVHPALPTGVPVAHAGSVNGSTYTYEIAIQPFEVFSFTDSGLWQMVDLGSGTVVGLDIVFHSKTTDSNGMLCENAMIDKYKLASQFRDQTLVDDTTCGDWGYLVTDIASDCYVNLSDFAIVANDWMNCTDPDGMGCTVQ